MYNFNSFSYYCRLKNEVSSVLPETLKLNGSPSTESILFRLLLGTLDFKHDSLEFIIEQNISYTKIAEEFIPNSNDNPISDWINGEFGIIDLNWYFLKNRRNKQIFDELLTEFTLYFLYTKKDNHTSAFLHLYRALEYMSYSFPITYSSRASNFYSSFDTFKSFFLKEEQGQLKFFREFTNSIFDQSLLSMYLKIDTYIEDDIYDKQKIKIIKKLCGNLNHHDNGSIISIEHRYLLDFMINLRNRYFHFQHNRHDNISNINFNSESFFSALNPKFLNWLSMIYLEIATQGIYKLNLMPLR